MNLLIVNDIVLEADALAEAVSWPDFGITGVFRAYSAKEAKEVIRGAETIDVLLSDIEMPEENGLSLIRWIRENGFDMECVLLTCHAEFAYAQEGMSLGCQDYLTLPARYEDIASCVGKVAKRRQQKLEESRLAAYGKNWLESQKPKTAPEEAQDSHYTPGEIVEKCKQYIIGHISDSELSVTSIASEIYLNPIYLNRVFKKETGTNLSQWIIRERMELAGTLFRTTDRTAVDIALGVGYENYPYFSTVFKKYFGCTPSQYSRS